MRRREPAPRLAPVRPRPALYPVGAGELLRRFPWLVLLAGLVLAYGAGVGVGLAVKAAGWWQSGAPWERTLLTLAQRTVSPAADIVFLTLPWIGTNYTLWPIVALAVLWLWYRRLRPEALHLLVVQVGSSILNPALKFTLVRERPHLFEMRGQFALPSFPSGHAIAVTSVVMTAAWLIHRRTGATWPLWVAGVFWLLVLYSRIYLSVHWPTDVIAGIVVGGVWLLATMLAFRRLES
ncbi:MAG TPA: phosphatase PAP2 family protein [Longimicrobiales bacterium]